MLTAQAVTAVALVAAGWNPTNYRWNPGEFPIEHCNQANVTRTNSTPANVLAAMRAGINAWRSAGLGGGLSCTTYDARETTSGCATGIRLNDGNHNFFFEQNWTQGSQTLGVTHYRGRGDGCGTLQGPNGSVTLSCTFDGDIEFNDVNTTWSTDGRGGTDVTSIMVHEYGHFIGLDHCNENNTCARFGAIMYSTYPGGTVRVPFQDDITGACSLYPGTPGGVGYPCSTATQCTNRICVNAGNNGYCSQTCGTCPQGYKCGANPQNAMQNVCVRDDGTNKATCELCSAGLPTACANSGLCLGGLPETDAGRCAAPCPNPAIRDGGCATNFTCVSVRGAGSYCVPKSSDCTNLTNFTELAFGQSCTGDPACQGSLTCIGICTQQCTTSPDNCPPPFACETFNFQSGAENYCAPSVTEGQSCSGLKACPIGHCLAIGGVETCYKECAGNPNACNNAQTCETYRFQGGGSVSVCEPAGAPPQPDRPDSGVAPNPDSGARPDANGMPRDGGTKPGDDASTTEPTPDSGMTGPTGPCTCDQYFYCEASCACDAECPCTCDATFACDTDPSGAECSCDPECHNKKGVTGDPTPRPACACETTGHSGAPMGGLVLFGLALALRPARRRV